MLTQTEIELYSLTGMQKLFREKMGPIQKRDNLIFLDELCFVSNDFHPSYYHLTFDTYRACNNHLKVFVNRDAIRLPLSIDPNDEKRGLCGMIDWNSWQAGSSIGGGFYIQHQCKDIEFRSATPTEALLRALMVQEGIKE